MAKQERRQYKRIRGIFRVISEPVSDFVIDWSCDSRDVSEGGIRVLTVRELIPGSPVEISFTLPGHKEKLVMQSKVVWTTPMVSMRGHFEAGVEFNFITTRQKQIIRDYVEKYNKTQHAAHPEDLK